MNYKYAVNGGSVLWLTGLSGAGKSTLAHEIQQQLVELGEHPLILDGDLVRAAIEDPHWGFDSASRLMGSYRYSKLARMAAIQGVTVIVPTISMFDEIYRWNRKNIPGYFEVYLDTTEATRRSRDPKVLYSSHAQGNETNMAGLDHAIEVPSSADLIIDNNGGAEHINQVVNTIMSHFLGSRK